MSHDPAIPLTLHPSAEQLLHSPVAVAITVLGEAAQQDDAHLIAPVDATLITQPAKTIRPDAASSGSAEQAGLPRRMSLSDAGLIAKALAAFESAGHTSGSLSRPGSAEVARRARTRVAVPTTQRIARDGGAKDPSPPTEVFCLTYSKDGDELVAGCGDGSLRVFGTASNRLERIKHHVEDTEHLPTTCITFNPVERNGNRLLLAATADGTISHWNITDQNASCIRAFREPSTSVYAVDYQSDGLHFATGGRDHIIRFYDEESGKLIRACDNMGSHGHSNRIFAVKYHPTTAHVLLSGGWDNTVQIWDDRTGFSVRSIYGPHICGDALAAHSSGNELLTGSWREENALQRWDFGTGKLIETIGWNGPTVSNEDPTPSSAYGNRNAVNNHDQNCMLYACAYSPDESLIAAGGGGGNGVNQMKLFDAKTNQPMERVSFRHGLYALAFSPDGSKLAMGGVDPQMTIVNL